MRRDGEFLALLLAVIALLVGGRRYAVLFLPVLALFQTNAKLLTGGCQALAMCYDSLCGASCLRSWGSSGGVIRECGKDVGGGRRNITGCMAQRLQIRCTNVAPES